MYFKLKFCTFIELNIAYIDLFSVFLKLLNVISEFFLKKELHVAFQVIVYYLHFYLQSVWGLVTVINIIKYDIPYVAKRINIHNTESLIIWKYILWQV
jgi:hypothetical protein